MRTDNTTSPRHRSVSSALWLPLLACATILAGCSKDDIPSGGDNGRTPVTFSTSILTPLPQAAADAAPSTRTATDANGNAVWTQGDAVSISMLTSGGTLTDDILPDCANVRYNVNPATGALTPAGTPMYYPQSPQDAKVDFIAWHTAATPDEDYLLTLSTGDQTTADKQLALDPLYSNNAKDITPGTAPVPLQFRHLMSKVKFDLTLGGGLTGGNVTDVRLEGMIEEGTFDLRDGSVKNLLAPAEPIKALKSDAASDGADATYTALLFPQDVNTNATPRTIVVTVNGNEYSGTIPNEDVFTANAMCIYPVTVDGDRVKVGIPTTDVPWAEGELPTVTLNGKTYRLIRNADDLKRFADDVNGGQRDINAIQTANIDLKGIDNWVPINRAYANDAPFTGIYNGNGYTISNLTISSMPNGTYSGLFGKIGGGALLTGIHLRDVKITGDAGVGVGTLAGWVGGGANVTLCSAKGEINVRKRSLWTGGLVGLNYSAITRCRTDVTLIADATLIGKTCASAGGIAGGNYDGSLLFACHATGDVTLRGRHENTPQGNYLNVGGITGENSGVVSNSSNIYCCIAEGNVSATAEMEGIEVRAGGLAGFLRNGNIKSNYARGTAVAESKEGISGKVMAGAILGYSNDNISTIEHCYGTGKGGKGTSNLDASNNIVYNESPAAGDIYNIIANMNEGGIPVDNVPFTTYDPTTTPAYGISIEKKATYTFVFWQENDGIYPSLDFLNNYEHPID